MSQEYDLSVARRARRHWPVFGILTAALLLSGCSAVPEWADPTDWFAEEQAPTRVGLVEGQARTQPTGYPNLASVPNQPPKILSRESRAEVQAGLAADRKNAVYSGERLTGSATVPAGATQTATAQAVSDAPPAPKIGNELTAAARIPAAPAQTQTAQIQVPQAQVPPPAAQTQVAQASGATTQLRFPQFQNLQSGAGTVPAVAAYAPMTGAQLVAVIYFAHSSARLDGTDRGVLRDVVALQRQSGAKIRVIGHASANTAVTDQITHDLTNFEMSLQRANSVAAALIALGAASDSVRAEARSDKQPVYHEFMTTGQAGNRRAEIFLEN